MNNTNIAEEKKIIIKKDIVTYPISYEIPELKLEINYYRIDLVPPRGEDRGVLDIDFDRFCHILREYQNNPDLMEYKLITKQDNWTNEEMSELETLANQHANQQ